MIYVMTQILVDIVNVVARIGIKKKIKALLLHFEESGQ